MRSRTNCYNSVDSRKQRCSRREEESFAIEPNLEDVPGAGIKRRRTQHVTERHEQLPGEPSGGEDKTTLGGTK